MAESIKLEVEYMGNNCNQFKVNDYVVSEQRGDWICSCSIKYKRNPKFNCKHKELVRYFLLSPSEKLKLDKREERRNQLEKFRRLDSLNCKHIFMGYKEKGAIRFQCEKCKTILSLVDYKEYRKVNNLK